MRRHWETINNSSLMKHLKSQSVTDLMQDNRNKILLVFTRISVQTVVPVFEIGHGYFDVWIIWLPIFVDQLVNKTNWRTDPGCTEKGERGGHPQYIRVE